MDSKLSRLCDGLLEAGWLVAVISVPLFFNIHSERVFEPDKLTLMRSIAVFIASLWGVKFIDQKGWRRMDRLGWRAENSVWRQPFVLPIAALILVYLISTIFSVTPRVSWAGSYQRLQGTYTTLAYIVIGAAAASTIRTRAQIGRLVTAVIITSLPISFYGLLQHTGHDPLPWGGDVTIRVAGHMGNSIFIAAFLIMVLPLTLSRIIDAFTNILSDEHLSYADVLRSGIYIFLFGIQLIVIYWSGSRGPLLALAVALFSFVLVLLVSLRDAAVDRSAIRLKDIAFASLFVLPALVTLLLSGMIMNAVSSLASFSVFMATVMLSILAIIFLVALRRGWRWLWLSWLLLPAFLGAWLLLFNIPDQRMTSLQDVPLLGDVMETQLAWKELPVIGTYGYMFDPSQDFGRLKSNRVRVLIWDGVIDMLTPHEPLEYPDGSQDSFNFLRPLIGYGPESMYQAYNRFYPPELATVEARNATPDRSHNETFDALVITGLAGFLAWQALYLSVFYYGFRYLGVVGSRRDRNVLFISWIGGGFLGGLLTLIIFDPIYFGVAVPSGTIVGLIVYLFYYAFFGQRETVTGTEDKGRRLPFHVDRLLMNALLAAVIAHYVEIHFGIAISSTRMYFFLYIALMFLISYKLPRLQQANQAGAEAKRKRRSGSKPPPDASSGRWGPALLWAFLLALVVGILGFEFTNFVLPQGQSVASGADLSAGDIFYQSLFVNPAKGFQESPFIYLMIVLSWALGSLIVLSEMVKNKVLTISLGEPAELQPGRRPLAAGLLAALALAGLLTWFMLTGALLPAPALGASAALIGTVVFVWAAIALLQDSGGSRLFPVALSGAACVMAVIMLLVQGYSVDLVVVILILASITLWAAFRPQQTGTEGRFTALAVAAGGLVLALPLLPTGGWLFGLLLALLSIAVLILLWDQSWRAFLLPAIFLAALAWIIGITYVYLHTTNVREALLYLIFYQDISPISTLYTLFFRPTDALETVQQLRVLEAVQSMRFLSWFYLFMFTMLILAGISLAWHSVGRIRKPGSTVGYLTFFVAFIAATIVISQTNLRVVQADMVYKRGKPFDEQGMSQNDPQNWDVAIAIYDKALELAPWEDFYYLFLGRAYLERSAASTDETELASLYNTAEDLLLQAQEINPLNTDHTANLARLFTRWYAADPQASQSDARLQTSEQYYQDALQLSPQNSIIRNEYARLAFELKQSCDETLSIYEESLAIDPFYAETYFAMSDALNACAAAQTDEAEKDKLVSIAVETMRDGLQQDPRNVRGWLQLGRLLQQNEEYEAALDAYAEARSVDRRGTIPDWNFNYLRATVYQEMGDNTSARAAAEEALLTAPPDIAAQIEAIIAGLGAE